MNDVKLFLESCQSLVLYALVALSLGVLTASSAVALMKSVKLSAVKICRCGLLGVFFMSVMFGIGVSIGSVKVPGDPTNQVQQGQVSGEPLRRPGGGHPASRRTLACRCAREVRRFRLRTRTLPTAGELPKCAKVVR